MNKLLQPLGNKEIELKQFLPADAETLFTLTDKNRMYLREWLTWLDKIESVKDTEVFIKNSYARAQGEKGADFGIYHNGVLVGAIGFHMIDKINKKTTIGYWLDEKYQGKGIMTAAVKILINFAFKDLELNRVQINCAVGNNKSSALPKKLGFKIEGIARQTEWLYDHFIDWEEYSLLSEEWVQK